MKNSISKAKALPDITLNDVGGLPEEMKEEILQTLSILKDPERSEKMGLKAPKGILLYGPPGTGKTLLAQAIAHELGANFFSTSGSAFNELFVGVGASRVRSLFQNARKHTPAVIFIDEVDALAGKRKPYGGEEAEKLLQNFLFSWMAAIPMTESYLLQQQTGRICLMKHFYALAGLIFLSMCLCQIEKEEEKSLTFIQKESVLQQM